MGPKDILKVELAGLHVRSGGWVVEEHGQVSSLRTCVGYEPAAGMKTEREGQALRMGEW